MGIQTLALLMTLFMGQELVLIFFGLLLVFFVVIGIFSFVVGKENGGGKKTFDPSLVSMEKMIRFNESRVQKRFYRAGSSFPGYADLVGNTAEEKFCDFFARVLMIGFDREQMRAIILTYSMAEELIWPHYRHEADGFAHSYYGYKPSFSDQGMRVVIARLVKEGWLSADVLSQEPGTLVPAT